MKRSSVVSIAALAAIVVCGSNAAIGEPPVKSTDSKSKGIALPDFKNLRAPTLGGAQFWCDAHVRYDWRIQRHVLSGHYRLLDPSNQRCAAGSLQECQATLQRLARERNLPVPRGRVVVLLHGLGRTRGSLESLRIHLSTSEDWTAVTFGYPSTRADIATHARSLQQVLLAMPEVNRFDFVGHSMGNIVVRRYLAMLANDKKGGQQLAKIGRVVMMCPPNHGATVAEKLAPVELSRVIGGPAIRELGEDWPQLEKALATPAGEFGILAGGKGDHGGYSPLIEGDDDLVISVETTRLAGARDFRVVQAAHTYFMDNKTVQAYVQQFLQHGYFESDEKRNAIPAD